MRALTARIAKIGFFGLSGLALGAFAAAALLVALLIAIIGIKALLAKSPAERARSEAAALYRTTSGKRSAYVRACSQVERDAEGRFFRCEIRTARCTRSFLFYEEALDFGGYDLQPWRAHSDPVLSAPCTIRSDPPLRLP